LARTFIIFLAVLFGLPIVLSGCLMLGGAGIGGFAMLGIMQTVDKGRPAPVKPDWDVVNVGRGGSNIMGYELLVKRDQLEEGRTVRIDAYASIDELESAAGIKLGPGQPPVLLAPKVAQAECEAVLAAFAQKCVVRRAELSTSRHEGVHRLTMSLLFVERQPFGAVAKGRELAFIENQLTLNRQGAKVTRIDRRGQAALRREFYSDAAAGCRQNRTLHGNCAIQSLTISAGTDQSGQMVRVSGTAALAILQEQKTQPLAANAMRN